ncbi:MAG: glycosyltransferase family 9 protein [Myxococcales bacterium]
MVDLATNLEKIAVVQTAQLGDLLFLSPLVRVLKLAWPRSRVTLVTQPRNVPLGACIPGVDEVLPFDPDQADASLAGIKRVARSLKSTELIVVPQPTMRSAMLAWLSGAPTRVGADLPVKRRFFNVKVAVRAREPVVERAMDMARALGVEGPTELQLVAPAAEVAKARELLGTAPSVGLALGADWATKRWPVESYVDLARRAHESGLRPVLVGEPEDRPLADAFLAQSKVPVLDLVGKGPLETLAVLSLLKGVCGGDAGWVHAARAAGVPALLLFGPTDPGGHTLEYYAQALCVGLSCQPCEEKGERACPLGHQDCLKTLEPDRVWTAFSRLLAHGGRR